MDIGVVGLGHMGKAMAANLCRAGHHVRVWNRSAGPAQELAQAGAEIAADPRDVCNGDAVITMLADDAAMRAVVSEKGLLDAMASSCIHINMATVSLAYAQELAAQHQSRGLTYVAAPVFGRSEVAAAGKLNIVAAGPSSAIDAVQPLFDVLGQKTWRVGEDPVRANTIKIMGNFMLAAAIEAMGEAAAVAQGYGVSATDLFQVLTNTLFDAPAYKTYSALIAEERYDPAAFKLALGLKDVRLALAAGETVAAPMPFASTLRDNMLDAIAHGDGERDWSALARVSLRRAGIAQ